MNADRQAELLTQLQTGSTDAYQQLLDIHLPPVNRYVIRMLGNASDAEDITQEVFIRLWQKSERFNPELAKLGTWLHQIAHNLCIDYFRKNKNTTNEYPEYVPGQTQPSKVHASTTQATAAEPQEVLSRQRQVLDISRAMSHLPERQRSAIVMCHYQGLSNKEAAEILEISVDALESLLSRGRKKLRDLLQDMNL